MADTTTPAQARRELLLAIADDELVMGHRASHWTGVAPAIEEDLAFSTIAQDEINHADVWYQVLVAGESGGEGVERMSEPAIRDEVDALGLGRPADGYRHAALCERTPVDFATTLARHWCYDHADAVRLASLADSSDADIAAVATRLLHEERYHLEHADLWFRRLVGADEDARGRFRDALASVLPEAVGLFEPTPGEPVLLDTGVLPESFADLFTRWAEWTTASLDAAGLGEVVPDAIRAGQLPDTSRAFGGRRGEHSADFTDDVWPEMTHLYRAHPGATW